MNVDQQAALIALDYGLFGLELFHSKFFVIHKLVQRKSHDTDCVAFFAVGGFVLNVRKPDVEFGDDELVLDISDPSFINFIYNFNRQRPKIVMHRNVKLLSDL